MSETSNAPAKKTSWFKGLKAEWSKIIWPKPNTVAKESVAVVIITTLLSLLIWCVDFGIEHLLKFIY